MGNTEPNLRGKLARAWRQLPHLPRAMGLVGRAAPGHSVAFGAALLAQGLLPLGSVYLAKLLVDSLVAAGSGGGDWASVRPALLWLGALAGVLLAGELLAALLRYIRTGLSERVQDHIAGLIHAKSAAVDFAFYESPDFYDQLHRARAEAGYRPVALLEGAGQLAQNAITLLAMALVLLPFGLWLPGALVLSTLPACWVVARSVWQEYRWRLEATADERRSWYCDWVLTDAQTAAELRLFGLAGRFHSAYQQLRQRLRQGRLRLARRQGIGESLAAAAGLLITAGAMALMVWRAVAGRASLGDLALFYQAFTHGQRLMRTLLESLGQLFANCLFIGNLFEFLDLPSRVTDPAVPASPPMLAEGIRFSHVSFRYPGSQRLALRDFELLIPAGQIVALVGSNGAGKSTLIKLLCRLYDPDGGQIELDGVDLRDLPLAELRRRLTVLFQQPVHYNNTVAENIGFGDLEVSADSPAIARAAADAGADSIIAHLPEGYQTLLGKSFMRGTELSGGQWQRLALARAFLRRSEVILLDEPTSSMDSWAEADWLARLRRLAAGRTVLIITHRFSTAMHADMIHVMEEGRIVESGRHEELAASGGRYARAWAEQTSVAGVV